MVSKLLTSPRRAWHWLSTLRRAPGVVDRRARRRRHSIVAEAGGRALLVDCRRHQEWWSGVVTLRDASEDRVVHVCSVLRPSEQEALGDAEQDAQRIALMFAQ